MNRARAPLGLRAALVFAAAVGPAAAGLVWWVSWAAPQFSWQWMLVQMTVVLVATCGWVMLVIDLTFPWLARGGRRSPCP